MKKLLFTFLLATTNILFCYPQNVGINVINPKRAKLELNGMVGNTSAIFGGDGNGVSLVTSWPEVGFNSYFNNGTRYINNGYAGFQVLDPLSGYMAFDMFPYGSRDSVAVSSKRALVLNSLGNVGIGDVYPNALLQFPNTLNNRKMVLWESANNDHQIFGLGIESGSLTYNVGGSGDVHKFYCGAGSSASTTLMTIGGDKRVLIGTQAGGSFVGINSSGTTHTLSIRQAAGTGLYIEEAASANNFELYAGYYQPTDYSTLRLNFDGSMIGFFRPSGEYVAASDRRLKTNIRDMPSLLEKIMKLEPKVYEMKAHNSSHIKSIGFMAQDVLPLFPELVSKAEGDRIKEQGLDKLYGLNYSGFAVIAIKAIQEQQRMIEKLENEIADLKKKINR